MTTRTFCVRQPASDAAHEKQKVSEACREGTSNFARAYYGKFGRATKVDEKGVTAIPMARENTTIFIGNSSLSEW